MGRVVQLSINKVHIVWHKKRERNLRRLLEMEFQKF